LELNQAQENIENLANLIKDFEMKFNEETNKHKQTQQEFETSKQSFESEIERLTNERNSLKENISECKFFKTIKQT